ncbi:hypothetical protein [Tenuifilum thalassicum]|uniref:Uncharacterized protein n=1 Tax=Tenuifilum thalassicum TaxID=2590900 RepID=A0A7D3XEW9_9BACT|nr:hypothetical protein [Tenuifilum thalassicum]QKG79077.1 hypothetical protein FHG85_01955 [Tenuifilum thalassicum]
MNSRLSTYARVLSWLLMGVSIVITVLFFMSNQDVESVQSFIVWAYILFGIAAVTALVFPVINFVRNPKNAVKSLIGLGAIAVVFLIGYLAADATALPSPTQNPDLSNPSVLVISDTGLIATYILFGSALFLMLYTGIRSVFHK